MIDCKLVSDVESRTQMAPLPFPPDPSYPLTLSSTPDASSPSSTSPTPETTQILAANHLSSSPASAGPSACDGRSKAQRWCDDSAAGAAGATNVGAAPADAVPAGAGVVPTVVGVASSQNRRSYRDALVSSHRPVSRLAVESAGGGWETVQSRRGRCLARRPPLPEPRPVPVDLRGRCFNCFSADHRAARCSNRVRCFFCRRPGHRVSECPRRQTNLVALQTNLAAPVRRLVWRPISKEAPAAVTGADHAMAGAGADLAMAGGLTLGGSDAAISGKRRTRRGQRRRRAGPGGGLGVDPLLLSSGNLSSAAQDGPCPVRFIGRSRMIDRAELELRHALIVSVVGQEGTGCATEVREALASRFDLDADALRLRRAAPGLTLLAARRILPERWHMLWIIGIGSVIFVVLFPRVGCSNICCYGILWGKLGSLMMLTDMFGCTLLLGCSPQSLAIRLFSWVQFRLSHGNVCGNPGLPQNASSFSGWR
jgi:hypothetical protein